LDKQYRLKKNVEFQEVFKKGQSYANRQFVVYMLKKQDQQHFRVGLSVSKKVGNAVTRNRVKRYIKEVFLQLQNDVNASYDYIVIARKPTSTMDFFETKKSLIHILSIAKALPRSPRDRIK
jgi:ribonuclease P protein component